MHQVPPSRSLTAPSSLEADILSMKKVENSQPSDLQIGAESATLSTP